MFETPIKKGLHQRLCPLSPNYQEQIEKRKIGGRNARIKQNKAKILPKISYKCICEKCGKEYQIILTESQFKKKKHFSVQDHVQIQKSIPKNKK